MPAKHHHAHAYTYHSVAPLIARFGDIHHLTHNEFSDSLSFCNSECSCFSLLLRRRVRIPIKQITLTLSSSPAAPSLLSSSKAQDPASPPEQSLSFFSSPAHRQIGQASRRNHLKK